MPRRENAPCPHDAIPCTGMAGTKTIVFANQIRSTRRCASAGECIAHSFATEERGLDMKGPIGMIRRAPKRTALALLLTVAAVAGVVAWPSLGGHRGPPQKDMAIDAATRKAVVDTLIADLDKYYV